MRIKKSLLVLCVAGLGLCRTVARSDDTPQQAEARKAMEAKLAELQAGKAGSNAPESDVDKAYHQKLMELDGKSGTGKVDQDIARARMNQTAAPAASSGPPDEVYKAYQQKVNDLNAQQAAAAAAAAAAAPAPAAPAASAPAAPAAEPKTVVIMAPAQPAPLSQEEQDRIKANQASAQAAMEKKIAELNAADAENQKALAAARAEADAKQAEAQKTAAAAKPAGDSGAKVAAEAPKVAAPQAPAATSAATPAAPAPTTREARLAELLKRYRADQVTPHEYQVERAKILEETKSE